MSARMLSITVIGSGDSVDAPYLAALARDVGRIVAHHGYNLVTGSGKGVMTLVAEGFCQTPDRVGRSIGTLPGSMQDPDRLPPLGTIGPIAQAIPARLSRFRSSPTCRETIPSC